MCDRVIYEDLFMLLYCLDIYKAQKLCGEAVDDFAGALNFFLIGLLQVKCLKNFMML